MSSSSSNGDYLGFREDTLENRATLFCKFFCNLFLNALFCCNHEALGEREKAGKFAETIGYFTQIPFAAAGGAGTSLFGISGLLGVFAAAKFSASLGKGCSDEVAAYFGKRKHFNKAKKISAILGNYVHESKASVKKLKRLLIRCSLNIFEKYEYQLKLITCEYGWNLALHKLAGNCVDRVMNYVDEQYESLKMGPENTDLCLILYKGLVLGRSKEGILSCITLSVLKGKKIPLTQKIFPHPGRTVEHDGEKWPSDEVWTHPAIVLGSCWLTQGRNKIKYGFRLPFAFEEDQVTESADLPEHFWSKNFEFRRKEEEDKKMLCESIYMELDEPEVTFRKLKFLADELEEVLETLKTAIISEDPFSSGKWWLNKGKVQLINSFVERSLEGVNIVDTLNQTMQKDGISVITGLGGVGKSAVAKWYANHYDSFYDRIIWMDCDDHFILNNFRDLAASLKLRKDNSLEITAKEIFAFLGRFRSLFILDFADKDSVFPIIRCKMDFPSVHCLITSRCNIWGQKADHGELQSVTLPTFSEAEAIRFIKGEKALGSKVSDNDAAKLAETLQYLPLALRQAVAYIGITLQYFDPKYSIAKYLMDYEVRTKALLDIDLLMDYDRTVYNTWQITIDKIGQEGEGGKLAVLLMELVAYMESEGITLSIFSGFHSEELKTAFYLLFAYSMIQGSAGSFAVHRLVQQVTRLRNRDREVRLLRKCLLCLNSAPRDGNFLNHVTSVFRYAKDYEELCNEFEGLKELAINLLQFDGPLTPSKSI